MLHQLISSLQMQVSSYLWVVLAHVSALKGLLLICRAPKYLALFMQIGCSTEWLQRDHVEKCFISQVLLIACKPSEKACSFKGRIK